MGMRRVGWAEDGKNERSVGMCGCRKDTRVGLLGEEGMGNVGVKGRGERGGGGMEGGMGREGRRERWKERDRPNGGSDRGAEGWREARRDGATD